MNWGRRAWALRLGRLGPAWHAPLGSGLGLGSGSGSGLGFGLPPLQRGHVGIAPDAARAVGLCVEVVEARAEEGHLGAALPRAPRRVKADVVVWLLVELVRVWVMVTLILPVPVPVPVPVPLP